MAGMSLREIGSRVNDEDEVGGTSGREHELDDDVIISSPSRIAHQPGSIHEETAALRHLTLDDRSEEQDRSHSASPPSGTSSRQEIPLRLTASDKEAMTGYVNQFVDALLQRGLIQGTRNPPMGDEHHVGVGEEVARRGDGDVTVSGEQQTLMISRQELFRNVATRLAARYHHHHHHHHKASSEWETVGSVSEDLNTENQRFRSSLSTGDEQTARSVFDVSPPLTLKSARFGHLLDLDGRILEWLDNVDSGEMYRTGSECASDTEEVEAKEGSMSVRSKISTKDRRDLSSQKRPRAFAVARDVSVSVSSRGPLPLGRAILPSRVLKDVSNLRLPATPTTVRDVASRRGRSISPVQGNKARSTHHNVAPPPFKHSISATASFTRLNCLQTLLQKQEQTASMFTFAPCLEGQNYFPYALALLEHHLSSSYSSRHKTPQSGSQHFKEPRRRRERIQRRKSRAAPATATAHSRRSFPILSPSSTSPKNGLRFKKTADSLTVYDPTSSMFLASEPDPQRRKHLDFALARLEGRAEPRNTSPIRRFVHPEGHYGEQVEWEKRPMKVVRPLARRR